MAALQPRVVPAGHPDGAAEPWGNRGRDRGGGARGGLGGEWGREDPRGDPGAAPTQRSGGAARRAGDAHLPGQSRTPPASVRGPGQAVSGGRCAAFGAPCGGGCGEGLPRGCVRGTGSDAELHCASKGRVRGTAPGTASPCLSARPDGPAAASPDVTVPVRPRGVPTALRSGRGCESARGSAWGAGMGPVRGLGWRCRAQPPPDPPQIRCWMTSCSRIRCSCPPSSSCSSCTSNILGALGGDVGGLREGGRRDARGECEGAMEDLKVGTGGGRGKKTGVGVPGGGHGWV